MTDAETRLLTALTHAVAALDPGLADALLALLDTALQERERLATENGR